MFLITTADEHFWKTNESILFLGEWCKLFDKRSNWESLSYEVLPYHWDNREKLYQDYRYLDKLYERTLTQMADSLNNIHEEDHSLRYWRIVIGPWLYYFIQMLYDRYLSIISAIESQKVTNTIIVKKHEAKWLPKDFSRFFSWFLNDDYNHYIYSRIIEYTQKMPYEIFELGNERNSKAKIGGNTDSITLNTIFKILFRYYAKLVPDNLNKIVLTPSFLNTLDLIKLQLSIKQLPYMIPQNVIALETDINWGKRTNLFLKPVKNEFEQLLLVMIREQVPTVYVEGYSEMKERTLKAYPKNPKAILTATDYFSNEGFKFWAGHSIEHGAKLMGTQHGGLYGAALWYADEAHEVRIYDRYYTWGWKSNVSRNTKILSAVRLNKCTKNIHSKTNGLILLTLTASPRYFYHMYSVPISSSGMLSYFNDQMQFVRKLSKENQKKLLVRLYTHDYGWSQLARWKDEFPEIVCYSGNKSMLDQLNESKLFIGSYNATAFLEAFTADFPTVLFWNPNHWELRTSAYPFYEELFKVGILHFTPESAAAKVNEISHDPLSWWNLQKIQKVKNQFCNQFARISDDCQREWKEELLSIKKLQTPCFIDKQYS